VNGQMKQKRLARTFFSNISRCFLSFRICSFLNTLHPQNFECLVFQMVPWAFLTVVKNDKINVHIFGGVGFQMVSWAELFRFGNIYPSIHRLLLFDQNSGWSFFGFQTSIHPSIRRLLLSDQNSRWAFFVFQTSIHPSIHR